MNKATVTSTPLPPVTLKIEAAKRLAAYAAVDEHVKPEHRVIGIGSGTTVPYVVERIVQQGEDLNADVRRALRLLQHSFPLVRTLRLRGKLSG
jgi:DNA-binding transcriptional regulator LsrR (DeoR family)